MKKDTKLCIECISIGQFIISAPHRLISTENLNQGEALSVVATALYAQDQEKPDFDYGDIIEVCNGVADLWKIRRYDRLDITLEGLFTVDTEGGRWREVRVPKDLQK